MYTSNLPMTIEDVIKYLYEQKQDELAKVVVQHVRDLALAQSAQKVINQPSKDRPLNPIYPYPPYWQNVCYTDSPIRGGSGGFYA